MADLNSNHKLAGRTLYNIDGPKYFSTSADLGIAHIRDILPKNDQSRKFIFQLMLALHGGIVILLDVKTLIKN